MARGFSQKEGIDYEETFVPIARYTSIRSVLSLATVMKWKIHQMDVKTGFLNGVVEEEVYVEKPLGFETQSIMKNDVWDVVPRPEGKSIVTSKWIYKIKHATNGSI